MKKDDELVNNLVQNSKAAMIAAIEIHNKPLFSYRYEVCVLLIINAWELILKAYVSKNLKNVVLFHNDGTSKPFDECLACVASNLGKSFSVAKESIEQLYIFRNKIAHFYSENLDLVIYSLLKPNVAFYVEFIRVNFGIDLANETGLIVLPIGFMKPYSPIDFLASKSALEQSSEEVKSFIKGIVDTARKLEAEGHTESILVDFKMNLINETRIKNADLIAGINNSVQQDNVITLLNIMSNVKISDNPDAKEIRIKEAHLLDDLYTETYYDVVKHCKGIFLDFKQNPDFNAIMSRLKSNPELHYVRYLDPRRKGGSSKDYYSKKIYDELGKYYTKSDDENNA